MCPTSLRKIKSPIVWSLTHYYIYTSHEQISLIYPARLEHGAANSAIKTAPGEADNFNTQYEIQSSFHVVAHSLDGRELLQTHSVAKDRRGFAKLCPRNGHCARFRAACDGIS